MPSRRRRPPLFEYGQYWVDNEPNRDGFYRYWLEGRRVRRRKLAAVALDAAKAELISLAERKPASARSPETVMMATVLAHYSENVMVPKRSAAGKRTTVEKNFILTSSRLTDFMASRSKHGRAARVAELDLPTQRAFWRLLQANHGCSPKSISTYMSYIAAAVNDAARPHVIDRDGREEETQVLTSAVPIVAAEKEIADVLKMPLSTPKSWVPTPAQLAAFIDQIGEEHVFRYVVVALNTWARPGAITQINFEKQADLTHGLLDLNPPGREQNKKRRPIIPLTNNLRGWILHWNDPRPIRWNDEPVASVKKAVERAAARAGVGGLGLYTLRHFMATQVRRQRLSRGRLVSREQRSAWLGHTVREGSETTAWYETFDADFLADAREATDRIVADVSLHLKRRTLIPPTIQARSGLALVKGGKDGGR